MSATLTRCEADTFTGGVCVGRADRWGSCQHWSSHLGPVPEGATVRDVSASPSSGPWYVIGWAEVLTETTFHEMSQYPGADRILRVEPQRVMLTSNGYYCAYRVAGVVTGRGYYGGKLGTAETYVAQPYAYEVEAALTEADGVSRGGAVRYVLTEGIALSRA